MEIVTQNKYYFCFNWGFSTLTIEEDIEITYSYWDGSGHRRKLIVSV